MVSQKDIAQILGVSRSTVAAILSGRGARYSKDMQERVFAAARENAYRPNASAQVVRKGVRDKAVAIITPNLRVESVAQDILDLIVFLNDLKYEVQVFAGKDLEKIFSDIGANSMIRVVCVRLEKSEQEKCAALARKYRMRMVFRECKQIFEDFPAFDSDNEAIMEDMYAYLYDCGHRRIALLDEKGPLRVSSARLNGFLSSAEKRNVVMPEKNVIDVHTDEENILSFLREYRPTAFLTVYPMLALWLEGFLQKHSYRIPEDISIVSFGDCESSLLNLAQPAITAFREATIQEMISPLNQYLLGQETVVKSNFTRGTLVKRDSVRRILQDEE